MNTETTEESVYTLQELAKMYLVKPTTVLLWIKRGRFPNAWQGPGKRGRWYVPEKDLSGPYVDTQDVVAIEDIAEKYAVKGVTVRKWCQQGRFKTAFKIKTQRWYVKRSELETFVSPGPAGGRHHRGNLNRIRKLLKEYQSKDDQGERTQGAIEALTRLLNRT